MVLADVWDFFQERVFLHPNGGEEKQMTQGGSASPLRPIENGRELSGMSDPTVRPLTTTGVGRLSSNLDLYFLLYGFRALGHPDLKDAILEGRFHLVFLHFLH
jgi:hypothetical protein